MGGEPGPRTAVGPGMIKRKLHADPPTERSDGVWLDLERTAEVEVTSEAPSHPVEAALIPGQPDGWHADRPGPQSLRLIFPASPTLTRVRLVFEEHQHTRTQQFVLRVAGSPQGPWREVVRQQFNFSPSGSVREEETYHLDGSPVAALELVINPDMAGGQACASVQELRVA